MKYFFIFVFIVGMVLGLAFTFGSPPTPQPFIQNSEYSHFDIQAHSRDSVAGFDGMNAQHGADCAGPPAMHFVQSFADSVFICNDHVMTAANAGGYGLVALTPSQLTNCTVSCSVQWDMSTERQSVRDWVDVWLTPWADNLTLPFDAGEVDLQGVPRKGLHVDLNDTQNTWLVNGISNYVETEYSNRYAQPSIQDGIVAGTNQAAIRQTFKITVTGNNVKVERLASATATADVYFNGNAPTGLGADVVVQFAQHSYNPAKDSNPGNYNAGGVPATWHWFGPNGLILSPSVPFTLIHANKLLARTGDGVVTFQAPAPANAMLRFSGLCKVLVNGAVAPKQTFAGHIEHASSYFVPIAAGTQSVTFSWQKDDWVDDNWNPGCYVQDAAIWAKSGGGPLPTPTPTSVVPPTPTSTPVVPPTPTRTPTPSPGTKACVLRWGNNTIENYGQLTQAQCAARGN